jgi:hypothetical protein
MKTVMINGSRAAEADINVIIRNSQDMLDLMVSARYECGCDTILLRKENLDEGFIDLKTGLAGEILQKISNYGFKLAVIGDFGRYKSKSLRDFLYESNKAGRVMFVSDLKELLL